MSSMLICRRSLNNIQYRNPHIIRTNPVTNYETSNLIEIVDDTPPQIDKLEPWAFFMNLFTDVKRSFSRKKCVAHRASVSHVP